MAGGKLQAAGLALMMRSLDGGEFVTLRRAAAV